MTDIASEAHRPAAGSAASHSAGGLWALTLGSIGVVFGVITVVTTFAFGLIVVAAIMSQSVPVIVVAIALAVIALITLALVQSALQGIYAVALYRYAEAGEVGGGFEPKLLEQAFRVKAG